MASVASARAKPSRQGEPSLLFARLCVGFWEDSLLIICLPCSAELKAQLAAAGGSQALRVYSSPLTRTLETAIIVGEHLGILTTDARFQARQPLTHPACMLMQLQGEAH
jgi:broad specificity phosphatase PhoE